MVLNEAMIKVIASDEKRMLEFLEQYVKVIMAMSVSEREQWIKKHASGEKSSDK